MSFPTETSGEKPKKILDSLVGKPQKRWIFGKSEEGIRAPTSALNMGVVVVVPVAGLREHGEKGECEEEQRLGSHV